VRLTDKEQRYVRTALRFLRYRVGGWQPLADALGAKADSISKVLRGSRSVTASLAYGVARLTDASIDDLLARRQQRARTTRRGACAASTRRRCCSGSRGRAR
jgi:plasmid maintenance system antidote protein VapI